MTISPRLTQNIFLGFVIALFCAVFSWSLVSGIRAGKSDIVLRNTEAITEGLRLFFVDQDRYPSTQEFQNKDIMLEYFTAFPFAQISGGPCQDTFSYKSPTPKTYQLNFCLPKSRDGFDAGFNQLTQP